MRFEKGRGAMFLSHLDLLKALDRSMRRAMLPVAVSGGYHRRSLIKAGPALPVGVTSEAEYVDVTFNRPVIPEGFVAAMNVALPDGLRVLEASKLGEQAPELGAWIDTATYTCTLENEPDRLLRLLRDAVSLFMEEREVWFERRRPKGDRKVEARSLTHVAAVFQSGEHVRLELALAAGSRGTLRPQEFLALLEERIPEPLEMPRPELHRTGLFRRDNDEFISPFDWQEAGS